MSSHVFYEALIEEQEFSDDSVMKSPDGIIRELLLWAIKYCYPALCPPHLHCPLILLLLTEKNKFMGVDTS